MRDILGREVPEGSLVIGMTIGRGSDGMRFGIARGQSCVWKHWGLTKSSVSNVYLVENPSEQELKIKQEILDEIHKEELANKQKKQQRKALKGIPMKQLVVGGYYTDDKGHNWCYLGEATVKFTELDEWGRNVCEPEVKHGYTYVKGHDLEVSYTSSIKVMKSPKKLVSLWTPKDSKKFSLGCLKWTRDNGPGGPKAIAEVVL